MCISGPHLPPTMMVNPLQAVVDSYQAQLAAAMSRIAELESRAPDSEERVRLAAQAVVSDLVNLYRCRVCGKNGQGHLRGCTVFALAAALTRPDTDQEGSDG
jgi:hypothetical protein